MKPFQPPARASYHDLESALRTAEPLFAAAGLGLWLLDLATGKLWWSRLTYRLHDKPLRYDPNLEEAIAFYPEEFRPQITAVVEEASAAGRSWDITCPFVSARGRKLLLRSCGIAFRDGRNTRWIAGTCEDVTEARDRAAEHARLAVVVEQMTNAAIIADREGRTLWANAAFERLTGYPLSALLGRKPGHILQGPDTDRHTVQAIAAALARGEPFSGEILNYRADGTAYWIELAISPVRDPQGAITGFVAIESDATARRKALELAAAELAARRDTEQLLSEIVDSLPVIISAYDQDDRLLIANQALRETFPGLAPVVVPGTPLATVVRAWFLDQMQGRYTSEAALHDLVDTAVQSMQQGMRGTETRLADGRWLLSSARRTESGRLIVVRTDITALKQAELEARDRASHDALTGLLNRAGFFELLTAARQAPAAPSGEAGCLIVLDIDHFKSVNDVYGHEAGDRLLTSVARRLRRAIRKTDLAARLGGDEFALFLFGIGAADAPARVDAIQAEACRSVSVGSVRLMPSLSIGVAIAGQDGADCKTLVRNADRALYEAKRLGRGRAVFYADRLAEELADRRHLAERLRQALNDDRIKIALQPQQRMADGAIIGFEALARWTHARRAVPPLAFIAAAEEHGLAERLGRAVMRRALAAIGELRRATGLAFRVSVNVSTAQLLAEDFVDQVKAELDLARLPAEALELEITETVLLDRSFARIQTLLEALRGLGVRLALDDFGTGHASLTHVGTLTIDSLKIDRSFVEAIGTDRRRELIARTIIGLARNLELDCVAEGVETRKQYAWLESQGCNIVQGYLTGRPMTVAAAHALFARKHAPGASGTRPGRHRRAGSGSG